MIFFLELVLDLICYFLKKFGAETLQIYLLLVKIGEILTSLVATALIRALIGLVYQQYF